MPKTLKERVADNDSKNRRAGLVRVPLWVPKEQKQELIRHAYKLRGCQGVKDYVNQNIEDK